MRIGANQASRCGESIVAIGGDGPPPCAQVLVSRGPVGSEGPIQIGREVLAELILQSDGEEVSGIVDMRARGGVACGITSGRHGVGVIVLSGIAGCTKRVGSSEVRAKVVA